MVDEFTPPPIVHPDAARLEATTSPRTAGMLAQGRALYLTDRPARACIQNYSDEYVRWDDVFRLLGYIDAMAMTVKHLRK